MLKVWPPELPLHVQTLTLAPWATALLSQFIHALGLPPPHWPPFVQVL